MESISTHPFMCVLKNKYPDTIMESFREQYVLLLPSPNSLVGIQITKSLIDSHILVPGLINDKFVTLDGKGVKVDENNVSTEFGFQQVRVCPILQHFEILRDNTLKVIMIDRPIVGKFEKSLDEFSLIDLVGNDYSPEHVKKAVHKWSLTNVTISQKLFAEISQLRDSLLLISGFEYETAKMIYGICESSVSDSLSSSSNPQKWKLMGLLHRFIYFELYDCIWEHLKSIYVLRENVISDNIKNTTTQSTLSPYNFQPSLNIIPAAMELKKIESCNCPFQKIEYLSSSFTLMKQAPRHLIESDDDSQDILSICIVALITSGLANKLAHAAHMDMAIHGSPKYEFEASVNESMDCFKSALKLLALSG